MKPLQLLLLVSFSSLFPFYSHAQEQRTMTFDAATSLMIPELHALLVEEEGKIQVAVQMNRDQQGEPGVDQLEQGDLILMMNGKRAESIQELRSLYEGLENDAEIKVGVRRGDVRFIISGIKGDMPESTGGGMRMVMSMDTDGDGPAPVVVPSLGFLISDDSDGVIISETLPPLLPDELFGTELKGFLITQFNGSAPKSAEDFRNSIESLEIGESIVLLLSKDGDEKEISIEKPEPKRNVDISIDN